MLSLSDDRTFVGQASGGGEVDRAEALEMLESALGDRPGSRVAVFGGAWTGEDEPDYASARRFGKELAAQGIEVVCGGYQEHHGGGLPGRGGRGGRRHVRDHGCPMGHTGHGERVGRSRRGGP